MYMYYLTLILEQVMWKLLAKCEQPAKVNYSVQHQFIEGEHWLLSSVS